MDADRNAFEAWAESEDLILDTGGMDGGYMKANTHYAWEAWKVAHRAAQPAGVEDAASAADWDALQRKYLLRDECLAGINRYLDHAKQQGWQHVPIDIMQALSQVADAARLASKGEAA